MNEQMHKQVNQNILVFLRFIVNVYYFVKITALKKKRPIPWATHFLQFPLPSLASLGTVTTSQTV